MAEEMVTITKAEYDTLRTAQRIEQAYQYVLLRSPELAKDEQEQLTSWELKLICALKWFKYEDMLLACLNFVESVKQGITAYNTTDDLFVINMRSIRSEPKVSKLEKFMNGLIKHETRRKL